MQRASTPFDTVHKPEGSVSMQFSVLRLVGDSIVKYYVRAVGGTGHRVMGVQKQSCLALHSEIQDSGRMSA